jgi:hypothetical protein
MPDFASAELRLVKYQADPSSPLQSNLVLALNTAAKTGVFLAATARDTVLLKLFITQAAFSPIISSSPLLTLTQVVRTANAALTGNQYGSVIFVYSRCPVIESNAMHATPALGTATLTGKHIGNTLPSTPRLLGIQKAEIVSNTSLLERMLLAISFGLITATGVYNEIRIGKELRVITHAVSQTALSQGVEYDLGKGILVHSLVAGGERHGKEQILAPCQRSVSETIQTLPELLIAAKEGQLIPCGESKFDERLTIETGKSWSFDEQIILTISRAREFVERELLRSQGSESLVEIHQQLELLKSIVEKTFLPANSIAGKEQSLSKSQRDQFSVETHPQLGLHTAAISSQLVKPERIEKLRQFGLSSSQRTGSEDIANTPLELHSAAVTGKLIGKDLNAVPQEFPLLRAPVQDSGMVSQIDSPIPLLGGVPSGAFFGSGNLRGLRELVYNTGMWIGSFRLDESVFLWGTKSSIALDLKVQLAPCRSYDEMVTVERTSSIAADEIVHLGRTISCDLFVELTPCKSFDEIISLRKAGSGLLDEQVNLSRNYMGSVKADEAIEILPRIWFDEVITLEATPTIIAFDESLLAEKSGMAKADEVIDLAMTYIPPIGDPLPSYLRNAEFDESIMILKTEFDECITITNNHNVALLGDVIRDSDLKAKGIVIYAGQDFVLEQ